jgi:hypothetical protein
MGPAANQPILRLRRGDQGESPRERDPCQSDTAELTTPVHVVHLIEPERYLIQRGRIDPELAEQGDVWSQHQKAGTGEGTRK